MDLYDPNRFHNRKPASSTERFLGVVASREPLRENPTSATTTDELNEDDVVFFSGDYTEPNHSFSIPSSSSSPSTPSNHLHHSHHHNHKGFGFGPPDAFGILAALPENDESPNVRTVSHSFHKASGSLASSSSSSSSRLIPAIPKPPQDRISSTSSAKFPQSAPVNVPILSPAMMKARRRHREFDEDNGDEDGVADEEMLPPHEIVARNSAHSPMLACSVLEGVGRTLKGRDLRQVRNAIWRQTAYNTYR